MTCLAETPNISINSIAGPDRGKPVTANRWTRIPASMDTAELTASPNPPEGSLLKKYIYKNQRTVAIIILSYESPQITQIVKINRTSSTHLSKPQSIL